MLLDPKDKNKNTDATSTSGNEYCIKPKFPSDSNYNTSNEMAKLVFGDHADGNPFLVGFASSIFGYDE